MVQNTTGNNLKFTFLRVLFFWFCSMIVFAAIGPLMKFLPTLWSLIFTTTVASIVTLGLTAIFIRWERVKFNDVGLRPDNNSFYRALIGFIIGLLLPCLQAAPVLLTGHVTLSISPNVTLTEVLLHLLLFVGLSFREEIAFRAYPLRSLNYAIGPLYALLFISLIFGIEHVIGGSSVLHGIVGAGIGGLLYGIITLKTKGLAYPIGIHAAWNFGQWALGFQGKPGILEVSIDKEYKDCIDLIGFISYLIVMGLTIGLVYFYWKRSSLKSRS